MKPYWLKLVWLNLARGLLLMLPLASAPAFDSFDAYGTPDWARPDPGSYWQGSSRAPDSPAPGQRSFEQAPSSYNPREYTAPGYTSPKYAVPDDTPYADRDGSRFESHRYDFDQHSDGYSSDWYASDWDGKQFGADWRMDERRSSQGAMPVPRWRSDPRQRSSGESDPWSAREQMPSYRFRDDPQLEGGGDRGGNAGYRFRPLTAKELERQRESASVSGFHPSRKDPRQPGMRAPGGEAYGYEPDEVPGGFYQRFYRADN